MYKGAHSKYITFRPMPYAVSQSDRLAVLMMFLSYVQMGMDELSLLRCLPLIREKYRSKTLETSMEMQRTYTQAKNALRCDFKTEGYQTLLDGIANISDSIQPKVNVVRNLIRGRLVTRLPYNLIEAATLSAMTWLFFELANQSLGLIGLQRRENVTRAETAVQEIYDDIKESKYASMKDIVSEDELSQMIHEVADLCRDWIGCKSDENQNKAHTEPKNKNMVDYTKTNRTHEIDTFLRQIAVQNGLTCQNGMGMN